MKGYHSGRGMKIQKQDKVVEIHETLAVIISQGADNQRFRSNHSNKYYL